MKHQPEGVEAGVTAGAGLVGAVPLQHLTQGQIAQLGLVVGQLGDVGGWRRDCGLAADFAGRRLALAELAHVRHGRARSRDRL